MKLPISAMIVGFNEAQLLPACFESVRFCDEIIYTDLGSTDMSLDIAGKYANHIYHRAKVPSCEMIQAEVVNYLANDWVIFIDPDETIDSTLAKDIRDNFSSFCNNKSLGAVIVPWQFYFKKKKLKGTAWGGINKKILLVNRERFLFQPIVHYGRKLANGYTSEEIQYTGPNVLHHYWMNSFSVFVKKHFRYLKNEGKDNYNMGVRTGIKKILKTPFQEFKFSYIIKKGYRDLWVGLFLSIFWAFYRTYIMMDVYYITKKLKRP